MKSFKIIISVLLICLCLSGCSSNQGLSELTIVQGVGIDLDNDDTKITLQYLNLSKSSGSTDSLDGNITTIADGKSVNISDALSVASKSLSKEIFLGQNKIIVFGSEFAKKSMSKGVDYLLRSVESRPDVMVAMCDEKAKDVIENEERGARIPAENVSDLLKMGEKTGLGAVVTVNDLLNLYACETTDIFLPVLKSEKNNVSCKGIAIFSNDNYACTLDEYETFGFLFVEDAIDGGSIIVKNEEMGHIALEIVGSDTNRKVEIKNGKIVFYCDVKVKMILNEIEKGITVAVTEDKIKDIENLVDDKVKDMCSTALKKCFENKSDPFMVGRYVSKEDDKFYDSVKTNWKDRLKDIEIHITVNSKLNNINDNSVRQ